MFMTRRARTWVGWIACLALWFGLAAPTITHALPAGAAGGWVTVCTSLGMKTVKLDASGQLGESLGEQPGEAAGDMRAHCAFCCGGVPVLGLPPAPLVHGLAPEPFALWPRLFWAGPRIASVWATAQPRAPPLFG